MAKLSLFILYLHLFGSNKRTRILAWIGIVSCIIVYTFVPVFILDRLYPSIRRDSPYRVHVEKMRHKTTNQSFDITIQRSFRHIPGCRSNSRGDESTSVKGEEYKNLIRLYDGDPVSYSLLIS